MKMETFNSELNIYRNPLEAKNDNPKSPQNVSATKCSWIEANTILGRFTNFG